MKVDVAPSLLRGRLLIPAGKSEAQRLVAMAALCDGESLIKNFPVNDDAGAALRCAVALGAEVRAIDSGIVVRGNPRESFKVLPDIVELDCGESGLTSRLFTCIASLYSKEIKVLGSGSLMKRPFDSFHAVFDALGIEFFSDAGSLPLVIHGPMNPRDITIDGSISSQFVSGWLVAMSAHYEQRKLIVHGLTSFPYIELTLKYLQSFGVCWVIDSDGVFVKENGVLQAAQIQVPSDWSSAAVMLVAAALCAYDKLDVLGLERDSVHADKAILHLLSMAEIPTEWSSEGDSIRVYKKQPRAFDFDFSDCPDLVPVAMVLAAASDGECTFHNTQRLRYKESNRGRVMQEEFGKSGIVVEVMENEIRVRPGVGKRALFSSQGDHRIAMAMTVFAMANQGGEVEGVQCVHKSYPQFYNDLLGLEAQLHLSVNDESLK